LELWRLRTQTLVPICSQPREGDTNATICQAIQNAQGLSVYYDIYTHVVEVHAYGRTDDGHDIMRVYQIGGCSQSGKHGWKLMRLDETRSIQLLDQCSNARQPKHRRGDKAMHQIHSEV